MTHYKMTQEDYEDYLEWYYEDPMHQMFSIYSGYESYTNILKKDLEQANFYNTEGGDYFIEEIYPHNPEDNIESWHTLYLNNDYFNNYTRTINNEKILNILEKNIPTLINKMNIPIINPNILEQLLNLLIYTKQNPHNYISIGTYKISTTMFFLEKFITNLNYNEYYITSSKHNIYNIYLHKNIIFQKFPQIIQNDYLRILLNPIFPKYKMYESPF